MALDDVTDLENTTQSDSEFQLPTTTAKAQPGKLKSVTHNQNPGSFIHFIFVHPCLDCPYAGIHTLRSIHVKWFMTIVSLCVFDLCVSMW